MMTFPLGAALFVAAALLLCGPWLEARRAPGSLALAAGLIAGPAGAGLLPAPRLGDLAPLAALSAGWLALLAAESWDLRTLRAIASPGRLPLALAPAAVLGGCGWLIGEWVGGGAAAPGYALTMASLGLAVDPEGARHHLRLTPRPGAADRAAPARAAFALGLALLSSAAVPAATAAAFLLAPAAGLLIGFLYLAPLRLAGGRAFVQMLLLSLPLVGWGVSAWGGLSAPAVLFAAGVTLANDAGRRDLIVTALRDLERPFTLAMLALGGACLTGGAAAGMAPALALAITIAALAVVRPLCRGVAEGTWRSSSVQALPLSPLAIPLAMLLPPDAPGAGLLPIAAAIAYVLCEAAWLWLTRPRPGA